MIKEIYIDNFKCLVNFRINPKTFQLWLGDNGVGKTTVLDALRSITPALEQAGRTAEAADYHEEYLRLRPATQT